MIFRFLEGGFFLASRIREFVMEDFFGGATKTSLIAGCCVTELLLAMETAKNELNTRFECESDLLNYIYANNTRPDTA
jgi:hypothetical protein